MLLIIGWTLMAVPVLGAGRESRGRTELHRPMEPTRISPR